jgi:hypothetical protein
MEHGLNTDEFLLLFISLAGGIREGGVFLDVPVAIRFRHSDDLEGQRSQRRCLP